MDAIQAEVESIVASGKLGRSPVYARLLEYLAIATVEQRVSSEIEIATEVFHKGNEFASNQDSSVRVYVHNLRQRLERFYAENPERPNKISIPKGEYRLDFVKLETTLEADHKSSEPWFRSSLANYAIAALLLLNLVLTLVLFSSRDNEKDEVAKSQIWQPLLANNQPLLIVVGDYFILGELDSYDRISRMVREFNVNSPDDLEALKDLEASNAERYVNLNLSYLPQSMGFALNDVLSVIHSQGKRARVIPASKLRTTDLKSNHILYLGYLSGLGLLESYAFAASSLEIGTTYDELLHRATGRTFLSNAGFPNRKTYEDYALLMTFPGPGSNNQILLAAGTRDAGLMYIAEALASDEMTEEIGTRLRKLGEEINGYEALYKVVGSDRTSLDARFVYDGAMEGSLIWAQQP